MPARLPVGLLAGAVGAAVRLVAALVAACLRRWAACRQPGRQRAALLLCSPPQVAGYPTSIAALAFNAPATLLAVAASYTFEQARRRGGRGQDWGQGRGQGLSCQSCRHAGLLDAVLATAPLTAVVGRRARRRTRRPTPSTCARCRRRRCSPSSGSRRDGTCEQPPSPCRQSCSTCQGMPQAMPQAVPPDPISSLVVEGLV